MNLLNVENVSKTYMEKTVLDDVSVGINDNDKIGVVGTNGTGKSTLLGIVAGVISPDSGQVVQGNTLRISYLPQNPSFDMNKTLLENITDTIYAGGEHWDKMGEIKANLAKFGIDDPECNPSILSGGQKKRAALVIILLMAKAVNLVAKAVNPSISAIQSPSMPSPTRTSLFTNGLCGVGMNLVVMITWIFPPIPPTPSQLMKVSLTMEDKANSGLLPILSKA